MLWPLLLLQYWLWWSSNVGIIRWEVELIVVLKVDLLIVLQLDAIVGVVDCVDNNKGGVFPVGIIDLLDRKESLEDDDNFDEDDDELEITVIMTISTLAH